MRSMGEMTIRSFVSGDALRMADIQKKHVEISHDASILSPGFFHAPGFENGRNIICAVDHEGWLVGYAAICPAHRSGKFGGAHVLWLDLRVDPALVEGDRLRDTLLEQAAARAREIKAALSAERVLLSATYFAAGVSSIEYLLSRGFQYYESTYTMRRNLFDPIPAAPTPEGVEVRSWRMESEAEQRAYLAASASALRDAAWKFGELQHFMKSELWSVGTTFTAFAGGEVVGSVMVWYDPNLQWNKERLGFTERLFVIPPWRKRGIANRLLTEGMRYLRRRGMAQAELQLVSDNRRTVVLYEALGYYVYKEEVSLGMVLE